MAEPPNVLTDFLQKTGLTIYARWSPPWRPSRTPTRSRAWPQPQRPDRGPAGQSLLVAALDDEVEYVRAAAAQALKALDVARRSNDPKGPDWLIIGPS